MKVLVTGGCGFIGSHIVDILVDNGYNVVVVDNLSTGKRANVNKETKFYNVDLTSTELKKVFKKESPDFVSHQAAQVNVRHSIKNPLFDAQNNILGGVNLLECCKDSEVKKVVYASSGGAIYGNPAYLPCDENHPIKPISPYGVSKFAVEMFLNYYYQIFGLEYCALRYSNVYGPRQDPKGEAGVVAIFINNLLNKEQCIINGDGNQTRDFVYVKDVANATLLAFKDKCKCCAINIGSGKEISINEIYKKISELVGSNKPPVHGSAIKGEVDHIYLGVKLAKRVLGWKSEFELDTGLKETIKWFKK